ncbi:MAG: Asp-tRNA(Asn)/Glu-tRNA(Gln) amidotransferase subunit GatA [Bdellovibrio sp.]|nr:Asp-tRNA(Asn)/Glu-tRNA(Gln) amidotransferase subunit GatA [Bdellovibrio sp.]
MKIRQTHEAIAKKTFSFLELTQDRLKLAKENKHQEYITVCADLALSAATKADAVFQKEGVQAFVRNPILGIPLAIKDLILIRNIRNTCGSKLLDNYVAPYSASVIQQLEGAGAVFIGKTNLDEFGMGSSNENSPYGSVSIPGFPERVAGGSSGGSAAAVKSGSCDAALGTDTGGSIRLPSSFCGIVGIKPTYGRVSRYGQVAYASSLDQIGPMARTVEDAGLLLDLITGHDFKDSTSIPMPPTRCAAASALMTEWSKIRLGVPEEYFKSGLHPDVEKPIRQALTWAEKQGAKLVPVQLPHSEYGVAVYYLIAVSEASSNLARFDSVRYGQRKVLAEDVRDLSTFYEINRSQLGEEVKKRILLGTFALSAGYSEAYFKRACQVRRKIKEDFDRVFNTVDFIVGPVSSTVAFKKGEKTQDPLQMYLNDIFTVPANLAGLPAMSLPCGQDSNGLSVGLQLIGPAFSEEFMVSLAAGFEKGIEGVR